LVSSGGAGAMARYGKKAQDKVHKAM